MGTPIKSNNSHEEKILPDFQKSKNLFTVVQNRHLSQKKNTLRKFQKNILSNDIWRRILSDIHIDDFLELNRYLKNPTPIQLADALPISSKAINKIILETELRAKKVLMKYKDEHPQESFSIWASSLFNKPSISTSENNTYIQQLVSAEEAADLVEVEDYEGENELLNSQVLANPQNSKDSDSNNFLSGNSQDSQFEDD